MELVSVVPDVILAASVPGLLGASLGLAGIRVVPDPTGPVSAEGAGKDVDVVVKVLVRVALGRREVGHGKTPLVGHGLLGGDIGGDVVTVEPPDVDTVLVPFHCSQSGCKLVSV